MGGFRDEQTGIMLDGLIGGRVSAVIGDAAAGRCYPYGTEQQMASSNNVQVFNDLNFEQEVLSSSVPVFVDFTATWCGPCKQLAPIVDQLADELVGQVKVGKLDIDDSPITAGKYGVRGVPTVMVFKGGERAAQHVGLTTKQKLLDLVKM
jgi:thioredoxin 1